MISLGQSISKALVISLKDNANIMEFFSYQRKLMISCIHLWQFPLAIYKLEWPYVITPSYPRVQQKTMLRRNIVL